MATDLELVRHYTQTAPRDFSDELIYELLDSNSAYGVAAIIWNIIQGKEYKKVSVAAGSNRIEAQQRFEHAKEMFERYDTLAGGVADSAQFESVTMAAAFDESTEFSQYWWDD